MQDILGFGTLSITLTCSCAVVANVQNCNIVVNEFELQSPHSVYFPTDTIGKVCLKFRDEAG